MLGCNYGNDSNNLKLIIIDELLDFKNLDVTMLELFRIRLYFKLFVVSLGTDI